MPYTNSELPETDAAAATPRGRRGALTVIGVVGVLGAIALAAAGIIGRSTSEQRVRNWTNEQAVPSVSLAHITSSTSSGPLVLPGQVDAYNNAAVNARVTGYLRRWYVEIGARVQAGQLLAEIDTPDIDQQLLQARAGLTQATAALKLSQTTDARWSKLLAQGAVSKQDADDKAGDLAAKQALVQAASANVNQLVATKAFGRIIAPFSGVVTSRNAQTGQLVSTTTQTMPLFTVADDSKLRIKVGIPQAYLADIKPGAIAKVTSLEYPGRTFEATFVNSGESVSGTSGTLTAELVLDNKDHALKAGEFVQAAFQLPTAAGFVMTPSSALMFRQGGMTAAVVNKDGHVELRKITIARDLGASVEVSSGLTAADRVIDNPADTLSDGDLVRLSAPPPEKAARPA